MMLVLLLLLCRGLCAPMDTQAGEAPEDAFLKMSEEEKWQYIVDQARVQAQSGDLNHAIELCHQSLELKPHAEAHYLLSQIYLAKSQHKDSLQHIEQAARMDPENAQFRGAVLFHQGLVAYAEGNSPEARRLYEEAARLSSQEAQGLEKVAIAVAALGDVPLTVQLLQSIWELQPTFKFHNSLPFVRVADLFEDQLMQAHMNGEDAVNRVKTELANITSVTHRVWMDVTIDGSEPKRVVFGLYAKAAPRAVKNFLHMVKCDSPGLCYKGSKFHRIIADFIVQGGDIELGNGYGVKNVYARPYSDDPYALILMNDQPGILVAANSGPDSNGGQFVVMLAPAPHLNGNHVVMGKVLEGLQVLVEANRVPVTAEHMPTKPVVVHDCGIL